MSSGVHVEDMKDLSQGVWLREATPGFGIGFWDSLVIRGKDDQIFMSEALGLSIKKTQKLGENFEDQGSKTKILKSWRLNWWEKYNKKKTRLGWYCSTYNSMARPCWKIQFVICEIRQKSYVCSTST